MAEQSTYPMLESHLAPAFIPGLTTRAGKVPSNFDEENEVLRGLFERHKSNKLKYTGDPVNPSSQLYKDNEYMKTLASRVMLRDIKLWNQVKQVSDDKRPEYEKEQELALRERYRIITLRNSLLYRGLDFKSMVPVATSQQGADGETPSTTWEFRHRPPEGYSNSSYTHPLVFDPMNFPGAGENGKKGKLDYRKHLFFHSRNHWGSSTNTWEQVYFKPYVESSLPELIAGWNQLPGVQPITKDMIPAGGMKPKVQVTINDPTNGEPVVFTVDQLRKLKAGASMDETNRSWEEAFASGDVLEELDEKDEATEAAREVWKSYLQESGAIPLPLSESDINNLSPALLRARLQSAVSFERERNLSPEERADLKTLGGFVLQMAKLDGADIGVGEEKGTQVAPDGWGSSNKSLAFAAAVFANQKSLLDQRDLHEAVEGRPKAESLEKQLEVVTHLVAQKLQDIHGKPGIQLGTDYREGEMGFDLIRFFTGTPWRKVLDMNYRMGSQMAPPEELEEATDIISQYIYLRMVMSQLGLKTKSFKERSPYYTDAEGMRHSYDWEGDEGVEAIEDYVDTFGDFGVNYAANNPDAELVVPDIAWGLKSIQGERKFTTGLLLADPKFSKVASTPEKTKARKVSRSQDTIHLDKNNDGIVDTDEVKAALSASDSTEEEGVPGDPEQKAARDFLRQREMPKEDRWKGTARQPITPAKPTPKALIKKKK